MKDQIALLVAVLALVAMGVFVVYLAHPSQIDGKDLAWARLQYLFGAIEAIAFAGAGWLWGKEVHRQEAASAANAHEQANKAAAAKGEATGKLNALAEAVIANADAINKAQGDVGGGHGDSLSALIVFAERMRTRSTEI
jgi:hypothetical protein